MDGWVLAAAAAGPSPQAKLVAWGLIAAVAYLLLFSDRANDKARDSKRFGFFQMALWGVAALIVVRLIDGTGGLTMAAPAIRKALLTAGSNITGDGLLIVLAAVAGWFVLFGKKPRKSSGKGRGKGRL